MLQSSLKARIGIDLLACLLALGAFPAAAADWPDLSRLAIHVDNDEFTGNRPDDRWYSSGGRIDWLRRAQSNRRFAPANCLRLPGSLGNPAARRFISLGQDIYSQNSRLNTTVNPDDRPLGALLYLQAGQSVISRSVGGKSNHAMAKLEIGITGPAALGEQVQNGLHDILGVAQVQIWGNQIRPRLGINLHLACTTQLAKADPEGRTPLVLNARYELSVGNLLTQAGIGLAVAAGPDARQMNMPRPARLANPIVRKVRHWGVIAGASLRAVAYDASIDGDTYGYQSRVSSQPLQGDVFIGLTASIGERWQLTYALIRRSIDFKGPGVDQQHFKMQTVGQLVLQAPLD